eukprot:5447266-Amphidinium_carterae.1
MAKACCNEQYEPQQRTRFAGQLQALLSWKFAGDIEGRMEALSEKNLKGRFYVTSTRVEKVCPMLYVLVLYYDSSRRPS